MNWLSSKIIFLFETVPIGRNKLRVVKQIDPSTLDMPIPSMLLQPLIENADQTRTGG